MNVIANTCISYLVSNACLTDFLACKLHHNCELNIAEDNFEIKNQFIHIKNARLNKKQLNKHIY